MSIKEVFRKAISTFRKTEIDDAKPLAEAVAALARDDGSATVKDVIAIAEAHGVTPDELASLTEYQQETDSLRADAAKIGPAKFAFQKSIEQVEVIQRWMRVEIEKVKAAAREKLTDNLNSQRAAQLEWNRGEDAAVKLRLRDPRRAEVMARHGNKSSVVSQLNAAKHDELRAADGLKALEREKFERDQLVEAKGGLNKLQPSARKEHREFEEKVARMRGALASARARKDAAHRELDESRAAILRFENEAIGVPV